MHLWFFQLATQSADKLYLVIEAETAEEGLVLAQDEAVRRGDMTEDERNDPDAECYFYEATLIEAPVGAPGMRMATD